MDVLNVCEIVVMRFYPCSHTHLCENIFYLFISKSKLKEVLLNVSHRSSAELSIIGSF